MDYIEGHTLEAYVQAMPGQALPVKKAITIGIQVCDVLNYLHTQRPPIIFRDVKPANIMHTSSGQIYLIDFGIARHFAPGRARDTGPLGSPGYAAPERYGKTQTTTRTDIYGLGATLQTLVTGKDPLELQTGETSLSPMPRLHKKLQLLLRQMLEMESSKRPQNILEVKARLEELHRGRGRFVRSCLWGFLLGVAPYALFVVLASFAIGFVYPMLLVLYCLWPVLFAGQLIVASVMLFQPRKRLVGLGILTGIALLVLAALLLRQWQPSFLLSWPTLGD
jgi:Protein kinase domain